MLLYSAMGFIVLCMNSITWSPLLFQGLQELSTISYTRDERLLLSTTTTTPTTRLKGKSASLTAYPDPDPTSLSTVTVTDKEVSRRGKKAEAIREQGLQYRVSIARYVSAL